VALKSVLEIDVNDSAFVRYQEKFKEYTNTLSGTPGIWAKVTKEIDASQKSFKELVAAAIARQGYAKLNAAAEEVASRALEQQSRSWSEMARSSKSFAGNILDATRALLRWGSIITAAGGLLGAGGLWGIDRLAISAAGQRRSSTGLGISAGEQSAFNLNYGRVVDAPGLLSGVNESLTNVSQRGNLYRAGLTEHDIAGKDAAQVSALLITKLKALADQTPTQLLGNIVGIRGLSSLGITEQDLRRLKDRPAGEIAGYGRQFQRDSRDLDLTPGQQKAWENFSVQLQRAGTQIEQTFIRELAPLAPELSKLSQAFSDSLKLLLGGEGGKSLIQDAATGLREFATFVSGAEFRTDMKQFAGDIGLVAHGLHAALGFLFGSNKPAGPRLPGLDENGQPTPDFDISPDPKAVENWKKFWDWLKTHAPTNSGSELGFTPTSYYPGTAPGGGMVWPATYRVGTGTPWANGAGVGANADFSSIEAAQGLPAGLLHAQYGVESNFGRNQGPSSAGALGPFQFLRGTWATYGQGGDINNLGDAAQGAGRYLHKLMVEFKGDIAKALAGYNWGEGNVENDIARHGAQWRSYLPRETQGYLNKILPQLGGQQMAATRVYIYNNTGGSAIVQASAGALMG
jgi:hypothetical protein